MFLCSLRQPFPEWSTEIIFKSLVWEDWYQLLNNIFTNYSKKAGRHSTVVSSAATILRPLGLNPKQTIHALFNLYCWNWNCICYCNDKRTKIKRKKTRIGPFLNYSKMTLASVVVAHSWEHRRLILSLPRCTSQQQMKLWPRNLSVKERQILRLNSSKTLRLDQFMNYIN